MRTWLIDSMTAYRPQEKQLDKGMNVFCGEGGVKVMTYERTDPEAHRLGRDGGRKGEQDMERGGGDQALWTEGVGLLHGAHCIKHWQATPLLWAVSVISCQNTRNFTPHKFLNLKEGGG